jgi:hypothetical protein
MKIIEMGFKFTVAEEILSTMKNAYSLPKENILDELINKLMVHQIEEEKIFEEFGEDIITKLKKTIS